MLVLPDTDAFRINLDQLGKRVHQATADTDGATDRHVIFGKLVAGYLGCGIDGCSVLTDHEHLYFAIIADIGNELFRLAACCPVPDSDASMAYVATSCATLAAALLFSFWGG